jgi:hypothetical protein
MIRVVILVMTPVIRSAIRGVMTVIPLMVTIPSGVFLVSRIIVTSHVSQDGAAWHPEDDCDYKSQHA